MASERKKVLFTFGNHMHWVDMQWLWGYGVLPGSVRDMLHLCREAGVKGNVNFDGISYEKMAAECPEALAELREAVKQGLIEPVGCSYGQPYGLFHGGESNIRQFTFGVRSVLRLLGVRPRAFWEEEFYFFPQLPQILRGCGFECANLYFQWTWHTPEVPREPHALILWEGIDGTRIPTLPRNALNLHQWPEDFELLGGKGSKHQGGEGSRHQGIEASRDGGAGGEGSSLLRDLPLPAIVQWLELMPSKDWMCRSELLLPKLKELLAHPEYEIVPGTMSEVVAALLRAFAPGLARGSGAMVQSGASTTLGEDPRAEPGANGVIPIRAYTMDDVWHGMTLGKNGDRHPRTSHRAEGTILAAQQAASLAGLCGRPYPRWDVYPGWELDEAWRELLAAQHHDNHECEGLCGDIGSDGFERADALAQAVWQRTTQLLAGRIVRGDHECVLFNTSPWPARGLVSIGEDRLAVAPEVPARGWTRVDPRDPSLKELARAAVHDQRTHFEMHRGDGLRAAIDKSSGMLAQLWHEEHAPQGAFGGGQPAMSLSMRQNGEPVVFRPHLCEGGSGRAKDGVAVILETPSGSRLWVSHRFDPVVSGLHVRIKSSPAEWSRPDPGLNAALQLHLRLPEPHALSLVTDSPFAVHSVHPHGVTRRKYPSGDWMTSPQWFESIERPFTAMSFVDCLQDDIASSGRGVLCVHDGSQQCLRTDQGIAFVLTAFDQWDEHHHDTRFEAEFWLIPHGRLTNSQRKRLAAESFACPEVVRPGAGDVGPDLPPVFAPFDLSNAPNVIAHAFFRVSEKDGEHLPHWAGHRMMRESGGACTHPFVVRLVEWDGEPAEVILKFPGEIAMAAKTNLMGEVIEGRADGWRATPDTCWLTPNSTEPPEWARGIERPAGGQGVGTLLKWSQVRFTMRPREIATIMADLVMGRKQFRDLDAKREVWATVHREQT